MDLAASCQVALYRQGHFWLLFHGLQHPQSTRQALPLPETQAFRPLEANLEP